MCYESLKSDLTKENWTRRDFDCREKYSALNREKRYYDEDRVIKISPKFSNNYVEQGNIKCRSNISMRVLIMQKCRNERTSRVCCLVGAIFK